MPGIVGIEREDSARLIGAKAKTRITLPLGVPVGSQQNVKLLNERLPPTRPRLGQTKILKKR